jgi:hypothetical protein
MPKFLDALKQGISEASSVIKEKGLNGWIQEKTAETGQMFGNAALDLAVKRYGLDENTIKQLEAIKDSPELIKQFQDIDLSNVDPELIKKNIEYLSKTDLSKTGLGAETAKEIIPEPVVEQVTETVKQEAPATVSQTTQVVTNTAPEIIKKFNPLDLNKNGSISDELLKVGLGVAGATALGYAGHKLYKHLKNKRRDMSLGRSVANSILGNFAEMIPLAIAGGVPLALYGAYKYANSDYHKGRVFDKKILPLLQKSKFGVGDRYIGYDPKKRAFQYRNINSPLVIDTSTLEPGSVKIDNDNFNASFKASSKPLDEELVKDKQQLAKITDKNIQKMLNKLHKGEELDSIFVDDNLHDTTKKFNQYAKKKYGMTWDEMGYYPMPDED